MPMPLDARERAELCAHLTELGPSAPTLCGSWTTADLAAHLVARERNPLAAPGIVLGGPLARLADWATARERERGYATSVERVRTGPPVVPWALPGLRELLNLNEYFVHHEDVRRANGLTARTDRPDLDRALTRTVMRMGPLLLHRGGVEVELIDDGGHTVLSRGHRPAKIIGRPGELLLWLNGRSAHADVSFDGDEDSVAALWSADLGI